MKNMVNIALVLALLVIALGAYTRLTEAGLGCPDWPGCYGFHAVPSSDEEIRIAQQAFPNQPVEAEKAWNEMIHRYLAGLLGLMILAIFLVSFHQKRQLTLSLSIALLVLLQAFLGMLTVTLNLQPLIVMGHLLGGFAILSLLTLLRLRLANSTQHLQQAQAQAQASVKIPYLYLLAIPVLVLQIALGGWTSANYAAIVCSEFPICNGDWLASYSLFDALRLPPLAESYQYGVFDTLTRMNIHISHRLWAGITFCYLGFIAISIFAQSSSHNIKMLSAILLLILILQVMLGISNVYLQLPLFIAVTHNLVAALLLTTLITLLWLHQQYMQEAV